MSSGLLSVLPEKRRCQNASSTHRSRQSVKHSTTYIKGPMMMMMMMMMMIQRSNDDDDDDSGTRKKRPYLTGHPVHDLEKVTCPVHATVHAYIYQVTFQIRLLHNNARNPYFKRRPSPLLFRMYIFFLNISIDLIHFMANIFHFLIPTPYRDCSWVYRTRESTAKLK